MLWGQATGEDSRRRTLLTLCCELHTYCVGANRLQQVEGLAY